MSTAPAGAPCPSKPVCVTSSRDFPGGLQMPYIFHRTRGVSAARLLYVAVDATGRQAVWAQHLGSPPLKIVGEDDPMPGRHSENFSLVSWPEGRGGAVGFMGEGSDEFAGTYITSSAPEKPRRAPVKLADASDAWPMNSSAHFAQFTSPLLLPDGDAVFGASSRCEPPFEPAHSPWPTRAHSHPDSAPAAPATPPTSDGATPTVAWSSLRPARTSTRA